ncbi:MAG: hypothetical protein GW949_06660 [Spirochaetales bacterium]|nr:hypothetical protein [Spirochaetales bacterium]
MHPDERLSRVVVQAIEQGERILGLSKAPSEHLINRVYRIRQKGWDRIYSEAPKTSPLERILCDRKTGEAWYAMRHMELAEWTSQGTVPRRELVFDYLQNLWDWANRLSGGPIAGRRNIRPYTTILRIGRPITLTNETTSMAGQTALEHELLDLIQEDFHDN